MAKFYGVSYLDGGPDLMRTRAATAGRIRLHLVSTYTLGDSYATVVANSLGYDDLTAGDIVSSGASGATRTTTYSYGTFTLSASASGTPNLHFALVDTVSSEVHLVTDENTNPSSVAGGGTVNAGSVVDSKPQPT